MNKKDINIIDIRKQTGSKSEIVSCENGEIIFAKDCKCNNKYYYSMNIYKTELDTVEEVYKYEIPEFEYTSQYSRVVGQDIVIIKMHFTNRVEIDVLDKKTKKLKSKHSFEVKEEVTSIPIFINSRYFIFYTDIDEMNTKEYYHFLYLCDLVEDKIYFIEDLKIVNGLTVVHGLIDCMPTFLHNNEKYLIFNETYMDDYEYELDIYDAIQENKVNKELVTDIEALYLISVNDFVDTIKTGKQNIPLREISKRYLNGWVRYLPMDEENIYYREKDFETQIEKIYAIDKGKFKTTVVKEIDHKKITGRLFYGDEIYERVESENSIMIKGLYNCDYNLNFKNLKNIWFDGLINDRYLITNQWLEDEEDNYFEFVYITDTKENKCIKYDGTCEIYNDCVIIYDNSGYWE